MTEIHVEPAMQNLVETGWPTPYGSELRAADDLAAGRRRWWQRRTPEPMTALRRWVWEASRAEACRRAQAARAACRTHGLGVACPDCRGTGIDPTGKPFRESDRYYLPIEPPLQPRCRLCGGIGLLAEPLTSPHAAGQALVDEHLLA